MFDLGYGRFGLGNAPLAEQEPHRFWHVPPDEQQQQRRDDADDEESSPTEVRNDQKAQQCGDGETNWKCRHDAPGHAAAQPTRAKFRTQRGGDRHLSAQAEVRQEAEDAQRGHAPRHRDQSGENRKDPDGSLERDATSDVVGDRAPKKSAYEGADQADGGQKARLRRAQAEFTCDRWQRRAEQCEVRGIEHDAEKSYDEEIPMPF